MTATQRGKKAHNIPYASLVTGGTMILFLYLPGAGAENVPRARRPLCRFSCCRSVPLFLSSVLIGDTRSLSMPTSGKSEYQTRTRYLRTLKKIRTIGLYCTSRFCHKSIIGASGLDVDLEPYWYEILVITPLSVFLSWCDGHYTALSKVCIKLYRTVAPCSNRSKNQCDGTWMSRNGRPPSWSSNFVLTITVPCEESSSNKNKRRRQQQ